jgi:hypothetical protein
MIYTAPYVMVLMRADPILGQVGGGWALEIETFGPVKWHRAVRRVPFGAHPPFPHLCIPLNSGECSKLKSYNLLEINRKLERT